MEIEIQIEMEIFLNPSTVRGVTKQHQYLRTPFQRVWRPIYTKSVGLASIRGTVSPWDSHVSLIIIKVIINNKTIDNTGLITKRCHIEQTKIVWCESRGKRKCTRNRA